MKGRGKEWVRERKRDRKERWERGREERRKEGISVENIYVIKLIVCIRTFEINSSVHYFILLRRYTK